MLESECLCVILSIGQLDLSIALQVALITNYYDWEVSPQLLAKFLNPHGHLLEGVHVGDVVDYQGTYTRLALSINRIVIPIPNGVSDNQILSYPVLLCSRSYSGSGAVPALLYPIWQACTASRASPPYSETLRTFHLVLQFARGMLHSKLTSGRRRINSCRI